MWSARPSWRTAVGVIVLAGCAGRSGPVTPAPDPDTLRRAVDRWLSCVECADGELRDVVAVGDPIVPVLESAAEGLSPAREAEVVTALSAKWRRTARLVGTRGRAPAMSEREYVSLYLDNRRALAQERAARALARIGSSDAEGALRRIEAGGAAGSIPMRASTLQLIRDLLAAMVP